MDEAVDLLQQNLDEEERALDLLKQLASDYEVEQEEGEDNEEEEEMPAATVGRKR